MARENAGNPAFTTGNGHFQAGTNRQLSTIMRFEGVGAVGVLFYAHKQPGTPRSHAGGRRLKEQENPGKPHRMGISRGLL